jgi:hypothetical protein
LFFDVLRNLQLSRAAAITLSALLMLSNAFLLAATDMLEPIWAVALGCASVAIALGPTSFARAILAGVILGVAGWVYQLALTMGLLVAGALAYKGFQRRATYALVATAATSCIVTFSLGVWGLVRWTSDGTTRLVETASGLFGNLHPKHLVGALAGAVNALVPLQNWRGVGELFRAPVHDVIVNSAFLLGALVAILALLRSEWRCRESRPELRWATWANLLVIWVFAAFWEPTYVKIWLFALPALFILVGITTAEANKLARVRILPLCGLAVVSLAFAIARASTEPEELAEARNIAKIVSNEDLLIAPGWDGPTVYLRTLIRPEQRVFSLTDETIACQLSAACVSKALETELREAGVQRRRVWVLGLLDLTAQDWDAFYGRRLRLPSDFLASLRSRSNEQVNVTGASVRLAQVHP